MMKTEKMDLTRFENLTAEREKLTALSRKLTELEEQKRKIEAQVTQIRKFNLADQAERLLDGSYESRDFNHEIEQLDNTIEVHQRAVDLQNQRVRDLKSFCSKEICHDLQPEYRQVVVKKMIEAARAMVHAIELNRQFLDQLERHEVVIGYLDPVFLPQGLSKDLLEAFIKSLERRT